jgi:hypothetical protein
MPYLNAATFFLISLSEHFPGISGRLGSRILGLRGLKARPLSAAFERTA